MIGKTIGKYRIVEKIGRGGMGTVYKAIDETLDRVVAIKTLDPDRVEGDGIKRFRAEAVTLAKLNHPRIATVYELARDDDALLMVMEFVTGETFERLVSRSGPLPLDYATGLCTRVLDALQYAHAAGVVHRDLKPANLMVTLSGDVKVMDFGIARVMGTEHLTTDGFMMGTPAYMAPEQVRGEDIDHRADLYATAVVLYRLLTGRLPFKADTAFAMIQSQLSDAPTPARQLRAELPDWLEAILTRGLAKSPADRFQTAEQFRVALELGPHASPAFPETPDTTHLLHAAAPTMPAAPRGSFIPQAASQAASPVAASGPQPTPSAQLTPLAQPVLFAQPAPSGQLTPVQPTPVGDPTPRTDRTVTLGKPHFVIAAALLTVLVIAVSLLAYAAFRRTSSVVQSPQPAAPLAAAPPASPPGNQEGALDRSAESVDVGVHPVSKPEEAAPQPLHDGPTPAKTTDKVKPAPAKTPADMKAAAAPAADIDQPPLTFSNVKALVPDGAKGREQDASLALDQGKLIVRDEKSNATIKALPYRSILRATYSDSKRPRWNETGDVAAVPAEFVGHGSVFQRAKHWLTLQSKDDFLILRLDKDAVPAILPAIENRTGLKIEKLDGDSKAKEP